MKSLKHKIASSKFFMAMLIIIMTNLALWIPMFVNIMAGTSIMVLTGSEYASLMIAIFGLYSGVNVLQKQVIGKLGAKDPDLDDLPPLEARE